MWVDTCGGNPDGDWFMRCRQPAQPWGPSVVPLRPLSAESQHKDSQLVLGACSYGKTGGVYMLIVQTWHLLRWRDGGVLCVVRSEADEVVAEK